MMNPRAVVVVAALALLACSMPLAEKKLPQMPDMSGPTTCVALYEAQADGAVTFLGASLTPSFHGLESELRSLMPTHLHHSFQYIGRTHGKSEKWLAAMDAAPITLVDGPITAPDFTKVIGDPTNPGGVCWCASPTRDPATKQIIGCDFPCGGCEHCVIPAQP